MVLEGVIYLGILEGGFLFFFSFLLVGGRLVIVNWDDIGFLCAK